MGESRSYIFETREISLAFWNEKRAISPRKIRSNIHVTLKPNITYEGKLIKAITRITNIQRVGFSYSLLFTTIQKLKR